MIMRTLEGLAVVLFLTVAFFCYCFLNPPTKADLTQPEAFYYSLGKR